MPPGIALTLLGVCSKGCLALLTLHSETLPSGLFSMSTPTLAQKPASCHLHCVPPISASTHPLTHVTLSLSGTTIISVSWAWRPSIVFLGPVLGGWTGGHISASAQMWILIPALPGPISMQGKLPRVFPDAGMEETR